jgi:two-component system OmpR family sensor kinase
MGRLFWKIFAGFWVTLVVVGAAVGLAVHLYGEERRAALRLDGVGGPRAELLVGAMASVLRLGGVGEVKTLLREPVGPRRLPLLVVAADGTDLIGRPVPEAALAVARERLGTGTEAPGVRRVTAPDGREYVLFVAVPTGPRDGRPGGGAAWEGRPIRPPPPTGTRPIVVELAAVLVASLLFSAGLAWYLTRPVRHLREASRRFADGALDTRVFPLMGGRRDDVADLGRDFDRMAERLQSLIGAQRRLLHDVSHELRSPLARMQVAVELARQQPDRMAGILDRIEQETRRLDGLVGEILTLARLEATAGPPGDEYVDLGELLDAVVADARFEANSKGREVALESAGTAGTAGAAVVRGRGELLHRAVENVLRNAVRFAPAQSCVAVRLAIDATGTRATVTICDSGPGVPADRLALVFEPFVRLSAATDERGYGLGLAIARRAVEAHGGTIAAMNRPEGGFCVVIELPLAAGAAVPPETAAA